MVKILLVIFSLFLGAFAQARSMPTIPSTYSSPTKFTYDVGAATGTENNNSYTEIRVSLNWFASEWLNWRNSLFTRMGSNVQSVNGLDSSLLATYTAITDGGGLGIRAFVGPGVRIASQNNNAATAEAGVIFKLGGIELGGGAKYLSYFNTRQDTLGASLPKDETQYFIVLAGGGGF